MLLTLNSFTILYNEKFVKVQGDPFEMLHLLTKRYPEDDPIIKAQAETMLSLLDGLLTEAG